MSLKLRSFPNQRITVTPNTHIFEPQSKGLVSRPRPELITAGLMHLQKAIRLAETCHSRSVERLLLVLPDKTRTQMAANLLLDSILSLVETCPHLELSVLYGLGTHPLMDTAAIQRITGKERHHKLMTLGTQFYQQSTKAVTNPMAFVTVWQDSPEQAIIEPSLSALKAHLTSAWTTAQQRGEQIWLGIFPDVVRRHESELVALLRSLSEAKTDAAEPILVDCRDAAFNAHLQAQLGGQTAGVKVYTPFLGLPQDTSSRLDIRFIDCQGEQTVALRRGDKYVIEVPEQLFTHDLTIIAGDTRIHPYEGRYGSGGINKMLAVGIASLSEIRRSHSTRVLNHPLTCPGEPSSPFVSRIAATARSIRETMLTRPKTRVMAAPYGLTAIGKTEATIWDIAFGQDESARRQLSTLFTQRYTVTVKAPLDVVISDVALHKATDITAGARALQYLTDWHRPDNVLLNHPMQGCVALLFNPCNEPKNNAGVGNDGTKLHMDVLGDLLQQIRPQLSKNLASATSSEAVQMMLNIARQTVMERWQHHLSSNSELTDWLSELQRIANLGRQQAKQGDVPRHVTNLLYERMDHYGRGSNHINRAIQAIEYQFQKTADWEGLIRSLKALASLYQEHEGLGEGGQRTIRLLKLCRAFKTLALATDNLAVLNYLNWLDPALTHCLTPSVRSRYHQHGIRASVLGLVPIHLKHTSANEAVQVAINYGQWHKPDARNLQVGVLTAPLILKRG
ncbi:MAG: hypothetical protein AAGH78_13485 [Cyanobacteria bacterium P01_H01_bin.58]